MDQDRARELFAAQEQARVAIAAATTDVASMPEGEERSRYLRDLATLLVGVPEEARASAIRRCPDLERAEPFPDTLLDASEQEFVSRLTPSDLKVIDGALVASSVASWRKVARVIGTAMVALDGQFPEVSHRFYVQRVGALVQSGKLVAQGDLEFMRLREVRLSAVGEGAT